MPASRDRIEHLRRRLFLLLLAGTIFGLVFSPPVLSIGLIGIVVIGLLDPKSGLNPAWRAGVREFLTQPVPLAFLAIYAVLLLGSWQTDDWGYYMQRLQLKVPLLALPIVWPGLPKLSRSLQTSIYTGIALFIAIVLGAVLVHYALNFDEVNDLVRTGKPVPVPRNHIRFSLLVAISVFCALRAYQLSQWTYRRALLGLAGFLFVGLHLLAVRSGLAGCYAGIAVYAISSAWVAGNWKPALLVIAGLFVLPVVAYFTLPSFRTKFDYARYELLHRDRSVDQNEYSDEGRWTSIKIGLEVWKDHPLLGVGPGNLQRETDLRYAVALPGTPGKRPHNQFVSALAGSGLLGFVVTLGAFLVLGVWGIRLRKPVYLAVWTILFLSCLVENTLENSVGVSTFTLFLLLLWEPFSTPSPVADRLPSRRGPS